MNPSPYQTDQQQQESNWIKPEASIAQHPHMSLAFARAYERTATRNTAPISIQALVRLGCIGDGVRLIDVGAGAGALSVPAAHGGAAVLAIDIAPGMIELLAERLRPFPRAEAQVMDGQALAVADGSFDAAFSIIGVNLFADWQRGLSELTRVVRPGGKVAVATWKQPPGGGPLLIVGQALRMLFPDRAPPSPPEGLVALSDPARLKLELEQTGLVDVAIEEMTSVWEGPAGAAYLDEMRDMHAFMGPFATLQPDQRDRVEKAIVSIVDGLASNAKIRLESPVLLATGTRA